MLAYNLGLFQIDQVSCDWWKRYSTKIVTMSGGLGLKLAKEMGGAAKPFQSIGELKEVIERVNQARVVMLGEASHGTHEYYEWRRLISQELVEKHGFNFISVEGDWPSSQRVNRYIKLQTDAEVDKSSPSSDSGGRGQEENAAGLNRQARQVLRSFRRWPTWMWANEEVVELVTWMRTWNSKLAKSKKPQTRLGFYGLDVYSLFESIQDALEQLEKVDPALARKARLRYECFDPFVEDEKEYARSLLVYPEGCKEAVIRALQDVLRRSLKEVEQQEQADEDKREALFDAAQNARIVRNAEAYYRAMILADDSSWNIRDRHMMETLDMLLEHYGPDSKGIVWAHNTHIGDYRATEMKEQRRVNIGGLAREKYGDDQVALVGFSTYEGTTVASYNWDGPTVVMTLPPARPGSWDAVMHEAIATAAGSGEERKVVRNLAFVFGKERRKGPFAEVHGQRAIGVVYSPVHERWGNYVSTSLARRYDVMLFLDETRALKPLPVEPEQKDVPETYPFAV